MSPWSRAEAGDESFERELFARRAREQSRQTARADAGVPSLASVLREVDGARESREARGRVLVGAMLAAACLAAAITGLPRAGVGAREIEADTAEVSAGHDGGGAVILVGAGAARAVSGGPLASTTADGPSCSESGEPGEESTCGEPGRASVPATFASRAVASLTASFTPAALAGGEPACSASEVTCTSASPLASVASRAHAACERETSCSLAMP